MYILLITFISNILVSLSEKHKLTRYIKDYDIVDCYISHPRSKRNLYMKNEKIKGSFDAEVRFRSHKTDFHLLLREDTEFKKVKVESYSVDNTTFSEKVNVNIFEGVMRYKSSSSHVVGYILDDVFTGCIKFNETIYFVEPASKFSSNFTNVNKIIVYREEDTVFPRNVFYNKETKNATSISSNLFDRPSYESFLPKGILKTKNENEDYACEIELVSDHTLYKFFEGDIDKLTAYLYLHGKYSDFIFRRTDFDGDGKRDRIRIIVKKIFTYKSEDDINYPMYKTESNINNLLNMFALRTQEYCLSVCITYRNSPGLAIGASFTASSSNTGLPGGICQKPIPTTLFTRIMKSYNTAVVIVKSEQTRALPISVSLLAVAHEVGHNFGSEHDSMANLLCSPGGSKGFYLMHSNTQMEKKPLSYLFSPCSKTAIADVIRTRGECLKPYPAVCGNGVQEGAEDCDCGGQFSCRFIDNCCTPSDATPPEKGCTFRESKGNHCSPRENKCCLHSCIVNTDTKLQCHDDTSMCMISYCDGKSGICPEPHEAPDGYPCQGTSKSCSGGLCNSSVCLDNGLTECVCKKLSLECHICCEKAGECVTAFSLGFLTPNEEQYYAYEGSSCNFGRFQCDGSGSCINPQNRNIETKISTSLWWTIGSLTFALLVVVSVLVYLVSQYFFKS